MSAQSAAESLTHEFVLSPEFHEGLHKFFMQLGVGKPQNMLGVLRQFVNSSSCEYAMNDFWQIPNNVDDPELQNDDFTGEDK